MTPNPEKQRMVAPRRWRKFGPYLSERQWGTVREDYSEEGEAWEYLPHEHARSRAYRWGEDGIGGLCDEQQRLCMSVAVWNGTDPILKERLFGLTNAEGNHGEDVKELYYFLDGTPSHSYLKMLYKYPQAEFPYQQLVEENRRRDKQQAEFELMDTGVFADDRYFDVQVEYAKATEEDILLCITAFNRGPEAAEIHLLPQVWFRNTWSWDPAQIKPELQQVERGIVRAQHVDLGEFVVEFLGAPEIHFCENETNSARLFGSEASGYFKDGIHDRVVTGKENAVNPGRFGTKCAGHYRANLGVGARLTVRVRLRRGEASAAYPPAMSSADEFDALVRLRRHEADAFYSELQAELRDEDARLVQRQALAGMIWSKQFYFYDVPRWLNGDETQPAPRRRRTRNTAWEHLSNADVISMPDTWEYPWYAAWDLAFHCIPFSLIDAEFAKEQLLLLTREWYMHPNGQLPAYEWALGDVNPPVHAWATFRVFQIDRRNRGGVGDLKFLERVFHKLLLNFTWWVNRKDADGNNVFQGGFLGLDNIGVFDRSSPLPFDGHIDQADGTAWMAMYSLNMMRISIELALHNDVYEDIASKFFEHFLHIAEAIGRVGDGLWDEQDGFFYDWLHVHEGQEHHKEPLRVRSMVGLVPLYAVEVLEQKTLDRLPQFKARLEWFLDNRPDLAALVSTWEVPGVGERHLLSLLREDRLRAVLGRLVDEEEFFSPYGIRGLSRAHLDEPFRLQYDGQEHVVSYKPAESDSYLFGGNSNWRGPVWFPVNYLIIESLQRFHYYYGDAFRVECPSGSERETTLLGIADEISARLTNLFLKDERGRRAVYGNDLKHQLDPLFRDHVQFFEYFHGDDGRGVGAAHQTGWTGLIAKLLQPRRPELS